MQGQAITSPDDRQVCQVPIVKPRLSNLSMVLGVHAGLRMTCHVYGRMNMVTHIMQPRFINSSALVFESVDIYFNKSGSRIRDLFGLLVHWRRIRAEMQFDKVGAILNQP